MKHALATAWLFVCLGASVLRAQSTALPDATVGVPYSIDFGQGLDQIPVSAGISITFSFQVSGGSSLPPGLTLTSSGLVSGTPTTPGDYNFSVDLLLEITVEGTPYNFDIPGPVTLTVLPNSGPSASVAPAAFNFSLAQGGAAASQSAVISNLSSTDQTYSASAATTTGGSWLTVSPASGPVTALSTASVSVSADPHNLGDGTYLGTLSVSVSPLGEQYQIPVIATVSGGQGQLQVSQSGLRFQTVAMGGPPPSQSVTLLNGGSGNLNFAAAPSTLSGGKWLSVSPASGSASSSTPAQVAVSIDPTGLAAGDYYGQVLFSATGAANSPQTASVVLNVAAAGTDLGAFVYPTGLIFVGQAGGTDPTAKTVSVANPSNSPLTFAAATFFDQGNNWFTAQPANGSVSANKPATITVQPKLAGLAPGVYFGELVLQFLEDHTTHHIVVLLIVVPGGSGSQGRAGAAASACIPTKLLPVFTQLGAGFTTVAAWPTPVEVTAVDDCGNLLTSGSVVASFSDGDPALPLSSLNDGRWTATWQPRTPAAQVTITAQALETVPPLQGTASIGGSLQANPTTPSINAGGVVSAAHGAQNQPLPPGGFASIYGVHLSSGQNEALSLPLATQLGATQVILAGRALPLTFASDGQVNAILPYDVPPNTTQQLIVMNGPTISMPEPVIIAPAQPAIFTQRDGAGIVFGVKAGTTTQFPVDAGHPVSAGDAIVIYCASLGPVNPPVAAGSAAPSSPPAITTNPVTVKIGGKTAKVFFAGLVGGFAGLYQVNAYVPSGITTDSAAPLVISVAGFDSAPATLAVK